MRFNLRQIEAFRAIMVTGSVSGASRLLAVSQPAISRLLAHTEDRLGLKLFERIMGRVQPTPEARRLYDQAEQVHQGVLRINHLAEELREHGIGAMHVVASPSVSQALVPEAIGRFRQRHPDTRIEFEILPIHDIVTKVGDSRVDLGISILPVEDPNIVCDPIMEGRLTVVLPPATRWRRRAKFHRTIWPLTRSYPMGRRRPMASMSNALCRRANRRYVSTPSSGSPLWHALWSRPARASPSWMNSSYAGRPGHISRRGRSCR